MPTTRIRTAMASIAASAVVCSSLLTGCSITRDDKSASPPRGDSTSEPTPSPSDQPTASTPSASGSPSAPTTSTATTATAAPVTSLLAGSELPPLNATSPWFEQRTAPAGQAVFGLCQKFDLLSIGAVSVVERTYAAGTNSGGTTKRRPTGRAGEQIAEFPDAQNTVRASKVIEAWQRDCASRIPGTRVKVRPITDVAVTQGRGWWYLVSFERRGTGHFHSLGLAISGSRMTLLRMDHTGQDHNYSPGADPMELAVKAAAAKLG